MSGVFLSDDELVRRCLYLGVSPEHGMFPAVRKLIFDLAFHGGDYGYRNVKEIIQGPPPAPVEPK